MQIHFRRNRITGNSISHRQLDGKNYAVVPTTIIVAGVLNGGLIAADELQTFAERWNGRPIPVRHPQNASGDYISASSPDVIEQQVIGTFYNATFSDDRVSGEMWIDVEKVQRLGGIALEALTRLESGDTLEVSTGYFAEYVEEASGSVGGKKYTEVQHSLVPDHIALLPDEVGACSIRDGCGANRMNVAGMDFSTSVMVAFYLRPDTAKQLSKIWKDRKTALPVEEMHVTLAYLGEMSSLVTTYEQLSRLLSEFAAAQTVILAEVGGLVRFTGENEDAVALLVDSDQLSVFRKWLVDSVVWELDQPVSRPNQYIPHTTIAYINSSDEISLPAVERIPLAFDQLALSWGDQTVVFDMRGEMRDVSASFEVARRRVEDQGMATQAKTPCEKGAEVIITNTGEGADVGAAKVPVIPEVVEVVEATKQALPAELAELVTLVSELGGIKALKATLSGIVANQTAERDQLISAIKANKSVTLVEADLAALSVSGLRTLANIGSRGVGADYSGRTGAVMTNVGGDNQYEDYVSPVAK